MGKQEPSKYWQQCCQSICLEGQAGQESQHGQRRAEAGRVRDRTLGEITKLLKGRQEDKRTGASVVHYNTCEAPHSGRCWGPEWDPGVRSGVEEPFP